jgi:hypothetical protein
MKVFLAGMPTEPDVKLLKQAFELKDNLEISHEQVEKIIGVSRKTWRYRSIVDAWRRAVEREQNIIIGAIPGIGFKVLPPSERVSLCVSKVASGTRMVRRAGVRAAMIPTHNLSKEEQMKAEHVVRLAAKIDVAYKEAKRDILPPAAVQLTSVRPMRAAEN